MTEPAPNVGSPRSVILGARVVPYAVRRHPRARRLRLRVLPGGGLEVTLPQRATLRDAEAFIRQQGAWVLAALERLPPAAPPLAAGAELPFLGATLLLRAVAGTRSSAQLVVDTLVVAVAGGATLEAIVESWYRDAARRYFSARVAAHALALGVAPGRIAIKDTRSRWGSCSSKGNLNFSWRLLLAPAEVADYVAAHEVAHLRELNHSPRYWAHVAALCPAYAQPRAWLRQHGPELAAWPARMAPAVP